MTSRAQGTKKRRSFAQKNSRTLKMLIKNTINGYKIKQSAFKVNKKYNMFVSVDYILYICVIIAHKQQKEQIMNNAAFSNYYQNNISALKSFAVSLAPSPVDAEDLVQETLIKALRHFERFDPERSFKNWAFTILKNTFISKYNRKKKMSEVNLPFEDCEFAISSHAKVNNQADSNLHLSEIKECVAMLSENVRIPFEMYVEGYKYNEIAAHLDVPMGTIKSRINYARKKIQQNLVNFGLASAYN